MNHRDRPGSVLMSCHDANATQAKITALFAPHHTLFSRTCTTGRILSTKFLVPPLRLDRVFHRENHAFTMPFSSPVIEISDSDDDARPLPPASSQFSGKSFNTDVVDLCSSDDELPAPGESNFFRGVGQGKRKRGSISAASSRSPSLSYPAHVGESSDEEESPRKIARKVSGTGAL